MYFYQCVYQKLCLRFQVPSREGLYEWDMLPIKILKKKKKKKKPGAVDSFAIPKFKVLQATSRRIMYGGKGQQL